MLLTLGLLGWYLTLGQARDMSGMVTGLGQVGVAMPNGMGAAAFMGMWLVMMMAMMLPAMVPVVIAARARDDGVVFAVGFVATYLVTWLVVGLLALAVFLTFGDRSLTGPPAWLRVVSGAILVAAGLYQLTPWKTACLRTCRAPIAFVRRHGAEGTSAPLRAGFAYGAYCVGSCWALMAVLLVVGLMNLPWMAAIAVVFVAEKNSRHGALFTRVVGGGVAALGVAVAAAPPLLATISG